MILESNLFTLLGPLVSGRCYPDTSPDNPTYPLIIYQQVGGEVAQFQEQVAADKDNARMQVLTWSLTREEAATLARSARDALLGSTMAVQALSAPVSLYDEQAKLYGSRTDYSIWYSP